MANPPRFRAEEAIENMTDQAAGAVSGFRSQPRWMIFLEAAALVATIIAVPIAVYDVFVRKENSGGGNGGGSGDVASGGGGGDVVFGGGGVDVASGGGGGDGGGGGACSSLPPGTYASESCW